MATAEDAETSPDGRHPAGAVTRAYDARVAAGTATFEAAQRQVALKLDQVLAELAAAGRPSLKRLFRRKAPHALPRGLYLWGGVGRGKTMLMDLFFAAAEEPLKRRRHFNVFMAEMHERVAAARRRMAAGDGRDPVEIVATDLAAEVRLICFDEFSVTDIADAMLLGRLFTWLFARGVTLVATSNVAPDRLYEGGLNRGSFLPFLAQLEAHCRTVPLGAGTDYRLDQLSAGEVYLTPLGPEADAALDRLWHRFTGGRPVAPRSIVIKGRRLELPLTEGRSVRLGFDALCRRPLGAADYRAIARQFDTLFLEGVPLMTEFDRNEARRFIILIDTLYDEGAKLIVSAAGEPDVLYRARSGNEAFEFARTSSRLVEMRSDAYLHAPRRAIA